MCSGRGFSSSALFHSKIAETGHTNDTLEKAIYGRCDAMRELRRLLGRRAFPFCRRPRMLWACRSGANRDARLDNAHISDSGMKEAQTGYDEQTSFSHSCSLRTGCPGGLNCSWVGTFTSVERSGTAGSFPKFARARRYFQGRNDLQSKEQGSRATPQVC